MQEETLDGDLLENDCVGGRWSCVQNEGLGCEGDLLGINDVGEWSCAAGMNVWGR